MGLAIALVVSIVVSLALQQWLKNRRAALAAPAKVYPISAQRCPDCGELENRPGRVDETGLACPHHTTWDW